MVAVNGGCSSTCPSGLLGTRSESAFALEVGEGVVRGEAMGAVVVLFMWAARTIGPNSAKMTTMVTTMCRRGRNFMNLV